MKRALCALALSIVAGASSAATITNGSFEDYDMNGGRFLTVSDASASMYLPGWTVNGEVDLVGTYYGAGDGENSVDLNARAAGGISQTVSNLVQGGWYKISFLMTFNDHLRAAHAQLQASAGNTTATFGVPVGRSIWGWTQKSFVFRALSDTAMLSFSSLVSGASGPALDAVSIARTSAPTPDFSSPAPVPLPASGIMLLAGLAGAFGVRRRG